jgi:MOSC domain-containing protein YiiM
MRRSTRQVGHHPRNALVNEAFKGCGHGREQVRVVLTMKVLSVNVGQPRSMSWQGRTFLTGFRKEPVLGRVQFHGVNLVGDAQGDRTVHGGSRKSVYVYPSEHYPSWESELSVSKLPWGSFGENLTTVGWLETEARIGDRARIGTAEFEVTSPRKPCYKMEAAFQRNDMIRRFHTSRRSGFYLGGVSSGALEVGDSIEILSSQSASPTIAEAYPGYAGEI